MTHHSNHFVSLQKQINTMKKLFLAIVAVLLLLTATSCKKVKYCQCFAYVDNEDVMLGDDYYMMEHGTCNDKAKEIVGWGQVTCKEVDVEEDESWFEHIFNQLTNGQNGPK